VLARLRPALAGLLVAFAVAGLFLALRERTSNTTPDARRDDAEVTLGNESVPQQEVRPSENSAPQPRRAGRLPSTAKVVGQTIIGRLDVGSPDPELMGRVRRGEVGGVILFAPPPASNATVASALRRLQREAESGGNPGLLVAVDQEGGEVKRLPGPPRMSPPDFQTAPRAANEGDATGQYLSSLGVNIDLAPVLDVAHPGSAIAGRTLGTTPQAVATLGRAFSRGLESQGVAATGKHFPGLGAANINTDVGHATIALPPEKLLEEARPFIAANTPLVMVSNARYLALDPKAPAVFSRGITMGLLRSKLHFRGLVVTDDLEADAIRADFGPGQAAESALKAGVDLLLFARPGGRSADAFKQVLASASTDFVLRRNLRRAYQAVLALKRRLRLAD